MSSYNVDKNAGLIIGDGDFSVIGGTLDITENGVYDVTTYKNVDVDYNAKNEDVTITPELYEQEITPSAGYDGLGVVRVESRPLNLQSKQVAPSEVTTFVTADEGYDGLSSVTVDNVNAKQLGFEKEYYAEGHTFLGEEGTYNPFPEHSYGGIYITGYNSEDNAPNKYKVQNYPDIDGGTFPKIFNNKQKIYIKEFVFENCPTITAFSSTDFFTNMPVLEKVVLPQNITGIGDGFRYDRRLKELVIPGSVKRIKDWALADMSSLEKIIFCHGVERIGGAEFYNTSPKYFFFPSSLISIDSLYSSYSTAEEIVLENGFNCSISFDNLNPLIATECLVAMLEALADRTGQTAYTITFGTTNLNKLTAEQKAIAINKNWNLA